MNPKRAINLFDAYLRRLNLSEATRVNYCRFVRLFCEQTAVKNVKEVTKKDIENYLDLLLAYQDKKGKKLAKLTIQCKLKALRQFYNFLLAEEYILLNPCAGVAGLGYERKIRSTILTEGEMKKLLESISTGAASGLRDRTLLELLYATGLRRAELLGIKLKDVNLDEGLLFVKGKGNKERVVPLGDNMLKLLKAYLQKSRSRYLKDYREEHLFLSHEGAKLGNGGLEAVLKKHLKLARLKKQVCLHSLRHSFATHLLKHGAEIRYIQAILGHESIGTTQIYLNLSVPGLRKIYDAFHPLENELFFDVEEREKYIREKKLQQRNWNWKGWKKKPAKGRLKRE